LNTEVFTPIHSERNRQLNKLKRSSVAESLKSPREGSESHSKQGKEVISLKELLEEARMSEAIAFISEASRIENVEGQNNNAT
jgi:hypothetical protein